MSDETASQDPTPPPGATETAADGSPPEATETAADGSPPEATEPAPTDESPPEAAADESPPEAAADPVAAERDQHLDDLQRVSAEFANFRKQTAKRNADFAAQAGSRVAEALLPVLDACDAAALQGVEGVAQIGAQLLGELERLGLQVISDLGELFDPNRHDAAMGESGDEGQEGPVVAEILRTGYSWNGRVLRAAMVKVKG